MPSVSYSILVPEEATEDLDDRVTSFWIDARGLLLQLSSYRRNQGEQVSAGSRLQERIARRATTRWTVWPRGIHPDQSVDQAVAEYEDENNTLWVHIYLAWPHLTVYALISGPEKEVRGLDNWAVEAVRTIALVAH